MNAIDRAPGPDALGQDAHGFLSLYERRLGSAPEAAEARQAAASCVRASGLPGRRLEAWKYTDLRLLAGLELTEAPAPDERRAACLLDGLALGACGLGDADRLVFVGGRFAASLSRLPTGVAVQTGVGALAQPPPPGADAMAAVNTMLAADGAQLHIAAGVDAGRLLLILLGVGGEDGRAVSSHLCFSVLLEAGARLSLLEIAHGEGLYVNNPTLAITAREGARLAHVLLQQDSADAVHLSVVRATLEAGAAYDSFSLALGARLARHEVHAHLAGRGGEVQVNGAQLLDGRQHADLTSVVRHDAPACRSRQTVKNVLSGRSRGVFQGKIVVARAAQKTDGYQMNQALLLSDAAEIDSKPELEIYADDVKCSHGATAGALDEEQLFYLRSRGVPAEAARAILVGAFLADALALIDDSAIRGLLERAVDRAGRGSAP